MTNVLLKHSRMVAYVVNFGAFLVCHLFVLHHFFVSVLASIAFLLSHAAAWQRVQLGAQAPEWMLSNGRDALKYEPFAQYVQMYKNYYNFDSVDKTLNYVAFFIRTLLGCATLY